VKDFQPCRLKLNTVTMTWITPLLAG